MTPDNIVGSLGEPVEEGKTLCKKCGKLHKKRPYTLTQVLDMFTWKDPEDNHEYDPR